MIEGSGQGVLKRKTNWPQVSVHVITERVEITITSYRQQVLR